MELTELRKNYVIELNLKTNSKQTKESYISVFNKYTSENSRIYRMTENEIKKYMSDFRSRYSDSYYNIMGACLLIIYNKVLNQPLKMKWFESIKIERKFHNITSDDEFVSMMKSVSNIKHKFLIIILYSTGIRLNELLDIRLSDIDFVYKRIFIRSIKGGKNRYIKLHELTERYLRSYLKTWNPKEYLLNGKFKLKYSPESVRNIFKKASNGKYSPHSARHYYATNTIEHEDIFFTMESLGHRNIKSTLFYNHIPSERLKTSFNPMDKFL